MGECIGFIWLKIRVCKFTLALGVFTAAGLDEGPFHPRSEQWLHIHRLPFTYIIFLITASYTGRCVI